LKLPVSKSPTKLGVAAKAICVVGVVGVMGLADGPGGAPHAEAAPTAHNTNAATANPRPPESQLNLIARL
jgi:hypothetical protein